MRLLTTGFGLLVLVPIALTPPAAAQGKTADATAKAAAARLYNSLHAKFVDAKVTYMNEMSRVTASEEYRKAVRERDRAKLNQLRAGIKRPGSEHTTAFVEAAKKYEGTPQEVRFLEWLVLNGTGRAPAEAANGMFERHLESPAWGKILWRAGYRLGADAGARLTKLIEKNPSPDVKAWGSYMRAAMKMRGRNVDPDVKEAAEKELQAIVTDYPDSIPADRVRSKEFRANHLQIGQEAPDIAGVDVDGNKFKLSDYRGKVVVLDFWGDW